MSDELNFDLAPQQLPVTLANDPALKGKTRKCVLREASEDAACRYRNALLRATKLGPDGKPASIDGMADADPILVHGCLFEEYEQGGETKYRPFTLKQVQDMPARVVQALCAKAKEMSKIDEGADTAESLDKQITSLQERRARLAAEENGDSAAAEGSAKNSPNGTTASSGSPTSSASPSTS